MQKTIDSFKTFGSTANDIATSHRTNNQYHGSILVVITALLFSAIDIVTPLGIAGGVLYVSVILMTLWLPSPKSSTHIALLCSLLTLVAIPLSPLGAKQWIYLSNRIIIIATIWITSFLVSRHRRLVSEHLKTQERVEQLTKLIPICSVCKKVRSDKGYWRQIETYLTEHTGSQLSHSYCPSCTEKTMQNFRQRIEASNG